MRDQERESEDLRDALDREWPVPIPDPVQVPLHSRNRQAEGMRIVVGKRRYLIWDPALAEDASSGIDHVLEHDRVVE
jgi:hypothetical protein